MAKLRVSQELLDVIYPVGSIYMSINSANPSTLFGGTWSLFGAGRTPVCINTSDTDFNTVEKTGGEKTHKLTVAETPAHTHSRGTMEIIGNFMTRALDHSDNNLILSTSGAFSKTTSTWSGSHDAIQKIAKTNGLREITNFKASSSWSGSTSSVGSSGVHNNLQPYITCYIWKRTA